MCILTSPLVGRSKLAGAAGTSFDGARDLYQVMGYPREITIANYFDAYQRQDIAGRIVDAYPDATWRETPDLGQGETNLSQEFKAIDDKHRILRALHRLDRLTGIGHYGVLILGLSGAEDMALATSGNNYSLLYVQPHSERTAEIIQWEDDPSSARFGRPKSYNITTGVNWTGSGAGQRIMRVHHSRVIHVAEKALEDETIGTPRLERIWNRLQDLDKLLGGSAEMYWQNVAMLMQLNADASVEWDPVEQENLKDQIVEMQHGLTRWLRTRGVTAQNIAPGLQGADPSGHIDKQVDIIAGAVAIPKRILIGNEAGELASSQDETNWAGRIQERRQQFAGPSIILPLIKKLQFLGVMSKGAFDCIWPESDTLGELTRADIALKKAQAIATYTSSPGAELIVSPEEFRGYLGEEMATPEFVEDDLLDDEL
jgi:hypothetical protein